jgi:hypothetical protein
MAHRRASKVEKEVQAAPSRYHNRRQRQRGSRLQWETSLDRHTQQQVSGEATYELLQEASRRGLLKPRIPRLAQAQELWHDVKLHDLDVVPYLGSEA